ncbi:MAG: V-type ATP synthase subunit E [Gammaproteobacteria bacterium]|nr:V-type ATP synthase subunit E [Gammaproteobacteria bacterium]
MQAVDQVAALEEAIFERARTLADEHLSQAKRARQRIHQDSMERLHLLEEKEILTAKTKAEREFRRLVQASEIRMQAELDRQRWGLMETVLENARGELADIHTDDNRYLPLFTQLLSQAAAAIERDELQALVSDSDRRRYTANWEEITRSAAPDKSITLSAENCTGTGGVLVVSTDGLISVDNTFEGRLERLDTELHRVILERLFPSATHMGALFNG